MSESKITCQSTDLLAMLTLICRNEDFHAINCLQVEQTQTATVLVATDARRIGVLRIGVGSKRPQSVAIHRFHIERFALLKPVGEVEIYFNEQAVSLIVAGAEICGMREEIKFPNWMRILRGVEVPNGWTEMTLMTEFYDCWSVLSKLLGGNGFFFLSQSSEMAPIEVLLYGVPNFYGVLMPAHGTELPDTSWVKTLISETE